MTTCPSDQSKHFSHHKNGVLLSSTQPSRRTLVKGAAWSVPVIAASQPARAATASCALTVSAVCSSNGELTVSYSFVDNVDAQTPTSLSFTVTRNNAASEVDIAPGPGVTVTGDGSLTVTSTGAQTTGTLFTATAQQGEDTTFTVTPVSPATCAGTGLTARAWRGSQGSAQCSVGGGSA